MTAKKKQLLLAIVLGVAAVVMTQVYLTEQENRYTPKDFVKIAIAKSPLQAGVALLPSQISHKSIPRSYAPLSAVLYEDRDAYVGQFLSVNVPPGDYLMQNYFEVRLAVGQTLSEEIIGKQARAISIPVSQLNSLSGSIVSGDMIDILYTFTLAGAPTQMTVLLLQNIPVISTGEYSAAEQELRGGISSPGHYSAITLLLSIEDAAKLKFAEKSGTIDVLLRNKGDAEQVQLRPLTKVEQILGEEAKTALAELARDFEPSESQKALLNQRLNSLYGREGLSSLGGE